MKNLKLLAFLLLGLANTAFALDLNNPLPNWVDPSREKADGRPPVMAPTLRGTTPSDFRMPAEYEPIGAVVMGWAAYTPMLTGIARAITGPAKAQLWMVAGPASIPGVPAASYTRINAPLNTVWTRDYGPVGLSAGTGRPGIVDSIYRHYQYRRDDDAVPGVIGKAKGIGVYAMPIIMDGGNLLMDSKGTLFMTRRTYLWNSNMSEEQVNTHLKNYLKAKNIVAFDYAGYPGEPADGTGHLDMFVKLLNDHTVLVSVADEEPFKSNSEKAIAWFKSHKASDGEPYKIITMKAWYDGAWYTYTNSVLVNNTAIISSFAGRQAEDAAAKAAYEQGLPGVTVVQVPSDSSIVAGGAIHCVTQTIPVLPGKSLDATALPEFSETAVTVPLAPLAPKGDGSALDQLIGGK
ncbi:MAG: agmatine deiminase family protein [Elusimicrobiales bacterium]